MHCSSCPFLRIRFFFSFSDFDPSVTTSSIDSRIDPRESLRNVSAGWLRKVEGEEWYPPRSLMVPLLLLTPFCLFDFVL